MSDEQTKPSGYFEIVTPSDTVDFTKRDGAYPRALFVGSAGNLNLVRPDGTAVLFTGVTAGMILPVKTRRVNNTSTTTTAATVCALW